MSAHQHTTDCGLPGLATIPYGVHMCHFYETRADLAAALVPYFVAGIGRQERCVWITAQPLDAAAAAAELRDAGLNVDALTRSGRLEIRDHASWYSNGAPRTGAELVSLLLEEERRALAEGYSGLRISGNVGFVTPADWHRFMEYEGLLNRTCADRRIVALCSYLREHCPASEIVEVVQRHSCTLDRPDEGWRILPARV
jgi:hypothetical protein